MKKSIFIVMLFAVLLTACQTKDVNKTVNNTPFEANWESLKTYQTPPWFQDAKLGIFIHWGPYSVPAFGSEWYPRWMYMDSVQWNPDGEVTSEEPSWVYQHHVDTYGSPAEFGYKDFIPMFKAEKFNATEWIKLFKKAGAKYVVPVAEHHDGFAMYNSNYTRWNAVNMGPQRDVLGELSKASKEQGLYFGASSHFAFNWNYYNHKEGFDTADPEYADLYSRNHPHYAPADKEFLELWWNRTKDIIDNYHPDILWFDFVLDHEEFDPYHPLLAQYYYNKGIEWGKDVVLQTKNFGRRTFPEGTNVWDIERGKSADILEFPWQTDTSIGKNSWCYVTNWESKDANTLLDDLIDIVSKNGNMLLNVGPKADGTIPEDQAAILLEMGEWLSVNGDAIYGTRPWTIFGEGPTEVKTGHHTEGKNPDLTSADFRFTQKDGKIYVIAMDVAEDGKYMVKSLGSANDVFKGKIKSVKPLSSDKGCDWRIESDGLYLTLKGNCKSDYACAFEIEVE
ncbi:alpha-L-fucosidase [Saccharicrinis fermentans]|uniref:alpha-L-fucosidase n=1 Tax=Saccharicrinis fermentans DSM 9555 = JCM 21142 TaxID=869213 RepID=W7XWN4_9BACT|nr:alpha-L-fucosidase [Saccharicrinis fermentans]GAF02765.1 alpha-L-fucosidase [Saccharicrinis fermentans DSM 9555 = JCM 21142]